MSDQPILVTGAAGFIGFHVARALLDAGRAVVGLDSLNDYYDPALKCARLALLQPYRDFKFIRADLADRASSAALFDAQRYAAVIHLAAQAGVRHSISHPHAYADANLEGFLNVLEGCRRQQTPHLLYASSSSVYGANAKLPFSVNDRADHPVSLYAATKRANELMAYSYSHLYGLPTTGLRFFTIYGPWYRPDMAIYLFAKAIASDAPIRLFNHGRMRRDFTYIDDVTAVVARLIDKIPTAAAERYGAAPATLYNVGHHRPEELMRVVGLLEQGLGRTARTELLEMQAGDVPETFADIADLVRDVGYAPSTDLEDGIAGFLDWFRDYHR